MKLTIFQSNKGDCVMLTSATGKHMLVDGGISTSYREHVAPALGALRGAGEELQVVCVSHVDNDHISGVLRMLDDEVLWRVHDYQRKSGNAKHKPPKFPRPPKIRDIWHNAFHDQIKKNQNEITDALAASATILTGATDPALQHLESEYRNLATGIPEAIRVSQRIRDDQLGIPLNRPAKGKLMMVRRGRAPIKVGGMSVFVLAPFEADLKILRDEWNQWLQDNKQRIAELRRSAKDDVDRLGASDVGRFIAGLELDAKKLGLRSKVTPPNLASLMLLVEEGGKTVLLTGDGHANEIMKGLEHYGHLAAGAGMHVDVLKIPHHGSEFNTTPDLCKRITADHYVFCGNGSHENPDLAVVDLYADSRLGGPKKRSSNLETGNRFTMWFNSSSTLPDADGKRLKHFRAVEAIATKRARSSGGQMKVEFMTSSSKAISL